MDAIGLGDLNVVRQLVELGANNFDEGLSWAAKQGDVDIAKYLVEKGATDFNTERCTLRRIR